MYVAPLKALLNDLADRLGFLTESVGLSVGVWHGDVSETRRRSIVRDPPDILLVTPESLEALLSFASEVRRAVLAGVRAVVVDEVHVFFGSDRGTQLLAICERLAQYAEHDLQRVGLSATIGNPHDLAAWLAGSSKRPMTVESVGRDPNREEKFALRYAPERSALASALDENRHEKTLVFCPGRRDVEEVTRVLTMRGYDVWPHHSALAMTARRESEEGFRAARAGFLVATSTLELGIDIGDLDRVVQIDAPPTVSALVQRLGRTGRRAGRSAELTFIARTPDRLVLACALLRLHAEGWIEPLQPTEKPWLVLVQQLLAHVLQSGGLARRTLSERLRANAAFLAFSETDLDEILDGLLRSGALEAADGIVVLGPLVERRFAARNFGELSSVFTTDETVDVLFDRRLVGSVQRWYIEGLTRKSGAVFLLAGSPWRMMHYDRAGKTVVVERAENAKGPIFLGGDLELGSRVCAAIRTTLAFRPDVPVAAGLPDSIDVDAQSAIAIKDLRHASATLALAEPGMILARVGTKWRLLSYAGLRANRVLACLCSQYGVEVAATSNTGLTFAAHFEQDTVLDVLGREWTAEAIASSISAAKIPAVSRQQKFGAILSATLQDRIDRATFFDVAGAEAILATGIRQSRD